MKTPNVTVENYAKVYEYFREIELPTTRLRRWYGAMNFLLKPRVRYADDARHDLDRIRDKKYHHIYTFNHRGDWDAYEYFSILHDVAPYDVGNIHALANSFLFEASHLRPLGKLMKDFGLMPVFLRSYYSQDKPHKDHPERLNFIPQATAGLLDLCTYMLLDRHKKLLICPEGEYNKGPVDTILPIQKGTAEIARRVAEIDGPVAITPIGLVYGKKQRRFVQPFRVSAFVERSLFVESGMSNKDITQKLNNLLLSSVKNAAERY